MNRTDALEQAPTPSVTVVITTRNRKDELRQSLQSIAGQTIPVDVLVIDDASSDGTLEMVHTEFSSARIIHHDTSKGCIVRRNEAARIATTPIIISIDDDATFPSPCTVEQTVQEFNHDRIGAVAIPFINVRQDDIVRQRAPDQDHIHITDRYIGTAHALRRELFLSLNGYREQFVHQGEEGDFCLRMLDAGYVVRLGSADPIHHHESPRRDLRRMDYYGHRNLILHKWYNVPWPFFAHHVMGSFVLGAWHGLRMGRPRLAWAGLLSGCWAGFTRQIERNPVGKTAYLLSRRLRLGPMTLNEVEPQLPQQVRIRPNDFAGV